MNTASGNWHSLILVIVDDYAIPGVSSSLSPCVTMVPYGCHALGGGSG